MTSPRNGRWGAEPSDSKEEQNGSKKNCRRKSVTGENESKEIHRTRQEKASLSSLEGNEDRAISYSLRRRSRRRLRAAGAIDSASTLIRPLGFVL